MNLDETQRQRVTAWILQGAKLSEIQSRLAEEFGLRLTYMEVRLLVDDLKLTPKDQDPPKAAAQIGAAPHSGHITIARRQKGLPGTRHTNASHRQCVRHRGPTHSTRCDCQRQGHIQRRPAGRLVSRPNGAARRCAQATRLQTVRCRRAAVSGCVAKRTCALGLLIPLPGTWASIHRSGVSGF